MTDSSGNAATEVTRTVNVIDTTIPVITLVSDAEITVEVGTIYTDLGATASDNYDGDISANISVTNPVDTSVIGSYTVTYNVTDSSGNAASEVTRTVNVTDTTAPVITLVGDAEITVEVGSTYTDLGATASDNYDGDISADIVTVNNVDTSVIGSYTVTYNVTDSSGNAASEVTRTVSVTDTTAPVITLVGDTQITVEVGTTYTDLGATASDNYDGDISADVVIGGDSVDTSTVGQYTVTYNVTDSSGNAATEVTRTVNVTDTTAPVITLVGDAEITVEVGTTYTDLGATASDNYDGDITADIVTVNNVNVNTAGQYIITYNVTDSSGNDATEVTRTVNVTDTTAPVITLVGDAEITVEVGSTYTDLGATASDNYDGDISADIVTVNNVDTSVIGSYTETYNVTDSSGNAATEVTRTVNVTDTTAPVITLVGDTQITVEVGSTYTDLGATASDNYDGDITADIVTVNNVDTSVIGTYTVTYNVSDDAGNAATEVTRTVNVTDTTAPVITLVGDAEITVEVGSTYTDLGATASDNYDGDITADIVTVNNVNVNTAGQYVITYNVTDSSGNDATEVTRTVNVTDTTAPVITLVGDAEITVEVGSTYTDLGATASDNYDGDITADIVTVNNVDTSVIGSYTVTYNVTDSSGNAASEVTRTVSVTDTTAPVITLVGDAEITVEVGSTYTDLGATASDNYDGDITADIVTVNNVMLIHL